MLTLRAVEWAGWAVASAAALARPAATRSPAAAVVRAFPVAGPALPAAAIVFLAAPRSRAAAPPLGNPALRQCRVARVPAGELRVERVFRSAQPISWRRRTAIRCTPAGQVARTSVRSPAVVSDSRHSERRRPERRLGRERIWEVD